MPALTRASGEDLSCEDLAHPLFAAPLTKVRLRGPPVAHEAHGDLRMTERDRRHDLRYVCALGGQRAKKLPPRRHVEEEIAHLDPRSSRRPARTGDERAAPVLGD